jgi:PIN domain nuclease of toxin-antitoxin system
MQYLLDTNVLLWYIQGDKRLPQSIQSFISNPENDILISAASIWEISIKYSLKQIELFPDLESYMEKYILNGLYKIINIGSEHAMYVSKLPFHHRDPFDRLIFAQSVIERIELLYTDHIFDKYKSDL